MSKFFFTVLSFFFLTLGTPTLANDVLTAQQLLTKLGYNPGPIDGSYGGKTEEALIKFYAKQDKKFDDHVVHMFIHGIYHILGFDHKDDPMADEMENKEIILLKKLNINNPYN